MNLINIPENWQIVTVEDIASQDSGSCVTGPFGSSIGRKFWVDNGVPVIRGNNLTVTGAKFIDKNYVFITEEYANNQMKRYHAIADDIIFTAAGTIGQVGIISPTTQFPYYIISNKQMRLRVNKKIVNPLFAFYYFRTKFLYNLIQNNNTGSTIPLINLGVLKSLPFPLPSLYEQYKIASILSSLDDKIELNLEVNKTLEEMAMAIYKEWFVNFGPFRDGEFVDSELGSIPKGWEVNRLKNIAFITMGQSPSSKYYNQNSQGFSFHQGVKDYGWRFPTNITYSTEGKRFAEKGDILFSVRAPVGRINIAGTKLILGRGLAGIRHREYKNNFLFYSLKTVFTKDDIIGNGTVYKSVNKNDVEGLKILLPDKETLNGFIDITEPIDLLIGANTKEVKTLQDVRDYLLPKLISGEIRVKEAEEQIQKVI